MIYSFMKGDILGRSHSAVHIVTKSFLCQVILRYMKWFILVTTLLAIHIVTRNLQGQVLWRFMKGLIMVRRHSAVLLLTRHLHSLILYSFMKKAIVARNHSAVHIVTMHLIGRANCNVLKENILLGVTNVDYFFLPCWYVFSVSQPFSKAYILAKPHWKDLRKKCKLGLSISLAFTVCLSVNPKY